jgi:hypothetical protein
MVLLSQEMATFITTIVRTSNPSRIHFTCATKKQIYIAITNARFRQSTQATLASSKDFFYSSKSHATNLSASGYRAESSVMNHNREEAHMGMTVKNNCQVC